MIAVRRTFRYAPPPWRVFDALVDEVDKWWCQRIAPTARVSFDPFEGGRFVQTAGANEVDYARVVEVERPRILRMEGLFGMQEGAVSAVTFLLDADGYGTVLTLEHECRGAAGLQAAAIRHAWGELLGGCLRDWLDTETPLRGFVNPRYPLTG